MDHEIDDRPLPISDDFTSPEAYVDELLDFITTPSLFRTLCGGVHVLDFLTRDPDLYTTILPQGWRNFFARHDIMDILDLLLRDDLATIASQGWKGDKDVPQELVEYITSIRRLSLVRTFTPPKTEAPVLVRDVALGMKVKKIHEVQQFSHQIHELFQSLPHASSKPLTHLIDLGSGQGYLPRALASAPYHHHVVGVESRQNNIEGSKNWDVMAKLAPKAKNMVNKKAYRLELAAAESDGVASPPKADLSIRGERGFFYHPGTPENPTDPRREEVHVSTMGQGSVQYISHYLLDGDLNRVVQQIVEPSSLGGVASLDRPITQSEANALPRAPSSKVNAMVIALHSCGNLLHHGLRSLLLTDSVKAVAMVGCCYNLLTERLGRPTYKLPNMRNPNTRVESLQNAHDPHGFPMSDRLCHYPNSRTGEKGIRLNITARMMAVQAPQNWGRDDSAAFFKRHFFRALLQRIFLDLGLVPRPSYATSHDHIVPSASKFQADRSNGEVEEEDTSPVILGSLPKKSYQAFLPYVRAAATKLSRHETHPTFSASRGQKFAKALSNLTDEEILDYEVRYGHRQKELAVVWSLMAFSAGVVESCILTDRWLFLKESEGVERAWVRSVFGYGLSPRNMVVIGVKKGW